MKSFRILGLLFVLMACSYKDRADWDSGAAARQSFQEETRQQEEENVGNQFPAPEPGTETPQPF